MVRNARLIISGIISLMLSSTPPPVKLYKMFFLLKNTPTFYTIHISVIESSFVETVLDIVRGPDPYYYYAAIAGLYISSNAKMVLAIKDSRFDSNGCTWNDGSDDCNHYTSIYAAVIESNNVYEHNQFLCEKTNFSNN